MKPDVLNFRDIPSARGFFALIVERGCLATRRGCTVWWWVS